MAIENAKVVDEMGILDDEQIVQMVIDDQMDWEEEPKHLTMIEAKVNGYLDFWRTGQISKKYPHAGDYRIGIKIVFKHKLPEYPKKVMNTLVEKFDEIGIVFSYDVLQVI